MTSQPEQILENNLQKSLVNKGFEALRLLKTEKEC
ncbi:MAG: hypothetical protein K0R65_1737 [Crocinitomicaceae bacterium]|jgi:hypothetical protein|nr:hypothetical protein [Crocinitomicaceae bacterium]